MLATIHVFCGTKTGQSDVYSGPLILILIPIANSRYFSDVYRSRIPHPLLY
jgi:hypothetical protein